MLDNLFNIAISLGQSNSGINEVVKDIFTPLLAVFLGAVFAHFFNIWYDKLHVYEMNKSKLLYLHNKLLTIYMDLKICNKSVNNKIELIEKSKLLDVINNTNTITFKINIKFEEFNFLSMYNKLFVVIIQMLNDRLGEFNLYLSDYNKYIEYIRLNWPEDMEYGPITRQLNSYLSEIKEFSEDLLGILHILLKGLDLCYKKHFNNELDYYDLSSNYLEDSFFSDNKFYKSNITSFNDAWLPPKNIKKDFKIFKYRFRQKIDDLKTYLMINGK